MSNRTKAAVGALVRYASSASGRGKARSRPRASAAAAPSGEIAPLPGAAPPANVASEGANWVEVRDQASGDIYYWNKSTNETTALGEPRPGPDGRRQQEVAVQSTSLLGMVGMGAGVGLVFALISRIF